MEPPPVAAGSHDQFAALAATLESFFTQETSPSVEGSQASTAPAVAAPEASEAQIKVKEWLAIAKGGLTHIDLCNACQKLSPELNWEIAVCALEQVQDKLTEPNNHMRLLWIIQDNLKSLFFNTILRGGKEQLKYHCMDFRAKFEFAPPLQICLHLKRLIEAIPAESKPSNNLKFLQAPGELQNFKDYLKFFETFLLGIITTQSCFSPVVPYLPIELLLAELKESKRVLEIPLEEKKICIWYCTSQECQFSYQSPVGAHITLGVLTAAGYSPCQLSDLSQQARENIERADLISHVKQQAKAEWQKQPVQQRMVERQFSLPQVVRLYNVLSPEEKEQMVTAILQNDQSSLIRLGSGKKSILEEVKTDIGMFIEQLLEDFPEALRQEYTPRFLEALERQDQGKIQALMMRVFLDLSKLEAVQRFSLPQPELMMMAQQQQAECGDLQILEEQLGEIMNQVLGFSKEEIKRVHELSSKLTLQQSNELGPKIGNLKPWDDEKAVAILREYYSPADAAELMPIMKKLGKVQPEAASTPAVTPAAAQAMPSATPAAAEAPAAAAKPAAEKELVRAKMEAIDD